MADDKYYDKGDKVRLHATFTVAGVLTDPTTITLIIRDPDAVDTTFTYALAEITRGSLGYFYHDFIIPFTSTAGAWHYRFESTGAVTSAAEKTFIARSSHFE
jgi:hypothetical protein